MLEALATQTCDAGEVAARLQESLSSELTSLKQPDPDTKKRIRYLCLKAKTANRLDVFKHLREIAPAGTTGEYKYIISDAEGYQGIFRRESSPFAF